MNRADKALNELERISNELEVLKPREACYFASSMLISSAISAFASMVASIAAAGIGESVQDVANHGRMAYAITFVLVSLAFSVLRVRKRVG